MKFEAKHYNRSVTLDNFRLPEGVRVSVSHWPQRSIEPKQVVSVIQIDCGPSSFQMDITAEQARELAANLIAHADEFEAHQAQFAAEEKQAA